MANHDAVVTSTWYILVDILYNTAYNIILPYIILILAIALYNIGKGHRATKLYLDFRLVLWTAIRD